MEKLVLQDGSYMGKAFHRDNELEKPVHKVKFFVSWNIVVLFCFAPVLRYGMLQPLYDC